MAPLMTGRTPLSVIQPIAEQLRDHLAPFCARIEIAGSIRRQQATVGDIELVAIPSWREQRNLIGDVVERENELLEHLDWLVELGSIELWVDARGRQCWGERLRKFTVTTRQGRTFKIDLFMCEPDNWGYIFLIRTGSQDFSKWCVTREPAGPLPSEYHPDNGHMWRNGLAVPLREEQDWFDILGIDFITPEERGEGRWS